MPRWSTLANTSTYLANLLCQQPKVYLISDHSFTSNKRHHMDTNSFNKNCKTGKMVSKGDNFHKLFQTICTEIWFAGEIWLFSASLAICWCVLGILLMLNHKTLALTLTPSTLSSIRECDLSCFVVLYMLYSAN